MEKYNKNTIATFYQRENKISVHSHTKLYSLQVFVKKSQKFWQFWHVQKVLMFTDWQRNNYLIFLRLWFNNFRYVNSSKWNCFLRVLLIIMHSLKKIMTQDHPGLRSPLQVDGKGQSSVWRQCSVHPVLVSSITFCSFSIWEVVLATSANISSKTG